jgi:hypothetical protein
MGEYRVIYPFCSSTIDRSTTWLTFVANQVLKVIPVEQWSNRRPPGWPVARERGRKNCSSVCQRSHTPRPSSACTTAPHRKFQVRCSINGQVCRLREYLIHEPGRIAPEGPLGGLRAQAEACHVVPLLRSGVIRTSSSYVASKPTLPSGRGECTGVRRLVCHPRRV